MDTDQMTGINDADPRAPEWRRMLAQIRAEHPEHVAAAQGFYDKLPFDPSPFEHLHEVICIRGHHLVMTSEDLERYGGLEVRRTSAERSGG